MPTSEVTQYQGYDYQAFDRASSTVLAKTIREVENAHIRDYPLAAQMNASGRWKMKQGGRGQSWPVKYKRGEVHGNTMTETLQTQPVKRHKIAALEDRGYYCSDAITELEVLQAQGPEAIVKIINEMVDNLKEDMEQVLPHQYFGDGNADGNEKNWHGFESFFGTNGTLTYTTGVQQAANQADYIGYTYDNYAGLSTELGALGGSQLGTDIFPFGTCDPQYEAWAPLVVVGNSSRFGGSGNTFATQGDEAIRFAITHSGRFGRNYASTTGLMDRGLWFQTKNLHDGKEEINVTRGDKESLVSLGFRDVIRLDGVELTWDNAVPTGSVYGYNVNGMEGRSLYPSLINSFGPRYDFKDQEHLAIVKVGGNIKFKSPRNFWKVVELHSSL